MSQQKIAKSLPKRVMNTHAKEHRKKAWATGQERKKLRQAENEARHQANIKAGRAPVRRRIRPRSANMKLCIRCEDRMIVAGSVCWCGTIGATKKVDIKSRPRS